MQNIYFKQKVALKKEKIKIKSKDTAAKSGLQQLTFDFFVKISFVSPRQMVFKSIHLAKHYDIYQNQLTPSNKALAAMARAETNKQLTMTEKTLIKNISIINEGQIFVADLIIESGIIQNTKKNHLPAARCHFL